jgi:hypothetical protein
MSNPFTTKDPLFDVINQVVLGEKKLTDAEMKKREEIAQAMERENPGMNMGKKMAIATAQAKKVAEEVEQIDEISDKTLGNYVSKAVVDVHNDAKFAGESGSKDASKKAFKRLLGVKSAAARLSKQNVSGGRISNYRSEEVDQDENLETFLEEYTTMFNEAEDTQQLMLLRAMAQDPSELMKMKRAIKAGDKALTNPILRQEVLKMLDQMMSLTTTDPSLLQRTRMGFQKKKMKMPEEIQLEAIGAKDKQDEGEYGYEGDMAMSQLRTIIRNCEEMMKVLDKETDLPEWVQSKITLATDYLQTANDYLMSELEEEVEQIDEAPKSTHENPLITIHDKADRLVGHMNLSTANKIYNTDVKHTDIHKGAVKTRDGWETKNHVKYALSRHHTEEVAKDAPFEGGREVKSSKSAAERVKKIAKGMEKHYNKDKK